MLKFKPNNIMTKASLIGLLMDENIPNEAKITIGLDGTGDWATDMYFDSENNTISICGE